jgi:hypothetical protein
MKHHHLEFCESCIPICISERPASSHHTLVVPTQAAATSLLTYANIFYSHPCEGFSRIVITASTDRTSLIVAMLFAQASLHPRAAELGHYTVTPRVSGRRYLQWSRGYERREKHHTRRIMAIQRKRRGWKKHAASATSRRGRSSEICNPSIALHICVTISSLQQQAHLSIFPV